MFDMNVYASLSTLAIAFVPVMLGIILHEVAHGWVAGRCGDQTAFMLGRITLNPVPHIDPFGLFMFVITALSPTGFIFGWAKPVPVNPRNFRHPRRDDLLVSAAGVTANLLLAVIFALLLKLTATLVPAGILHPGTTFDFIVRACLTGVQINFILAYVNLLPIPPLDGSRIAAHLLPAHMAWRYSQMGRYGFFILLALLMFGVVGSIVGPLTARSSKFLLSLLGLV